ncbi:MAG: SGNH/GDSL hydrolase family protein [Acidimicrobiales bacterium]
MRTRLALLVAAALAATGLVALSGAAQAGAAKLTYYVSVGDSYSVGYQPGVGATTGYAGYVAKKTHLTLANFGCGGATTTSIIDTVGCPDVLPHTAGAHLYPTTTQAAAAEAFITAHRGQIGLITVSIGGNDVTACATQATPIPCVGTAVTSIEKNVTTLATGLRAAAGPRVPIIGLTYPDVLLGAYVYPAQPATAPRMALASESAVAFKSLINPALAKAYAAAGGAFVDVTAATGAYTPLTTTVTVAPYGTIPRAVARVCTLTWYCAVGNIHATSEGYAFIGKLVAARYATLRRS